MRDHNSLTMAMAGLRAWFSDLEALTGDRYARDYQTLVSIANKDGLQGLILFMSKVEDEIIGWLSQERLGASALKRDKDGFPVFLNPLWRGLYLDKPAASVAWLRQTTALIRKIELVIDPTPSYEQFRGRLKADLRLLSDEWLFLVDQLADVLERDLPGDLPLADLFPYVSTGASRDHTPILDRCETIEDCGATKHGSLSYIPRVATSPVSRCVAVPKDARRVRIVCVEPAPRMLLQQALRRWLENAVENSRLSVRICFKDQDFQRRSLRMDGRSSIDLSDASDHLLASVIWRFLRRKPTLRSALFSARCSRVNIQGVEVVARCFSTMGNACTFTVMSIFLACLTAHAELDVRGVRASTVFGDDIVCDDVVAGSVLYRLNVVGMKPNHRKTFIGKRFKESCGLDIFDGQVVTPLAVKRWEVVSDSDVVRSVAQSNSAFRRGYWRLADSLTPLGVRIPVNTSSADDCLFSFCKGVDGRGARWIATEQRYVWDIPKPSCKVDRRDNPLLSLIHI